MARRLLLIVLVVFVSMSVAYADRIPVATQAQLVGCWSLVEMPAAMKAQMNEVDPYPQKYQWFCFEPDGTMHTAASDTPMVYTSTSLRAAFKKLAADDMRYEIMKAGVMRIQQISTHQEMGWQTEIFDQTYSNGLTMLAKGDMEMGLIDFAKGKVVYWRILTRMRP